MKAMAHLGYAGPKLEVKFAARLRALLLLLPVGVPPKSTAAAAANWWHHPAGLLPYLSMKIDDAGGKKQADGLSLNVHAGPQLNIDVFTPRLATGDGVVCDCLRLPAVVLDRGTLLAFAECRHYHGDGCIPATAGPPPKGGTDIALRTSSDSGRSWSPLVIIAKAAGHPTPTFDSRRNRTVLQFNQFEAKACQSGRFGNCTAFSYNKSSGASWPAFLGARGCCPNFQMVFSDRGSSWGRWQHVQPAAAVAWPVRVGSGTGIQLRQNNPYKPGRLLNVGWHL